MSKPHSPRVLLLLPTTTYRAHDFIEAGRRLGVETVVASEEPQTLEAYSKGKTFTVPLSDPGKAAAGIVDYAAIHPLVAIIPTDEPTAEIAALASERLGLRHNPPGAARAARYKDLLRATLRSAGVPTPSFELLPVEADPEAAARGRAYPVVLKPTHLSASRGVIRANDEAEFAAAFRRIKALLETPDVSARDAGASRRMLVEGYVPGAEVALEGILLDGHLRTLAIFDKPDPLEGPFFEETIYVTPSRLPEAAQALIRKTTADAAKAIGLVEGAVHAELRVDGANVTVIEVAGRSIGGLCSRTLSFGAGVSLEELILRRAAGLGIDDLKLESRAAGVMMLPIPRAGVLRGVRNLDEAAAVPGVEAVTITATTGHAVTPLPEGASYLGFIFARADRPEEVEAALREAHRRLTFTIDEGGA